MKVKITKEGQNKIRKLIYRKGKTNKEFAKEDLNCTPEHFSAILNNRFNPSSKLIKRIFEELKEEFGGNINWDDIYKIK